MSDRQARLRAQHEMAIVTTVVAATENRARDGAWWRQVADIVAARHGLDSLRVKGGRVASGTVTDRVAEALADMAAGMTVDEAALHRHKRPSTVHHQRSAAIRAMGARNAPHAVALALAAGIIQPPSAVREVAS